MDKKAIKMMVIKDLRDTMMRKDAQRFKPEKKEKPSKPSLMIRIAKLEGK